MNNKLYMYLGVAGVLLGLFGVGTIIYKNSQADKYSFMAQENAELFVRDYSPRYGNAEARVMLTEFLDPECESCRAFYPVVKTLLNEFKDRVQLVVRYAPFHGNSKFVIRVLEAARMQGKYWEALELLFYTQPNWGSHHHPKPELIFEYLPQLNLDMDKLRKDMESPKIAAIIKQDEADLKTLNVRRTPTFFANGKPLQEFSVEALRSLIGQEVAKAYKE